MNGSNEKQSEGEREGEVVEEGRKERGGWISTQPLRARAQERGSPGDSHGDGEKKWWWSPD